MRFLGGLSGPVTRRVTHRPRHPRRYSAAKTTSAPRRGASAALLGVFLTGALVLAAEPAAYAQRNLSAPIRFVEFNTDLISWYAHGTSYMGCGSDWIGASPNDDCRIPTIIDKLKRSNYDVIVLTEVFSDNSRDKLLAGLRYTYPWVVYKLSTYAVGDDSGLMLFSKWPIVDPYPGRSTEDCSDGLVQGLSGDGFGSGFDDWADSHVAYRDYESPGSCVGIDCFADKGVGYVRLRDPNNHYWNIFMTQLQASYADADYAADDGDRDSWHRYQAATFARRKQLLDAKDLAACVIDPAQYSQENFVFTGDLNTNGDLSNPTFDPADPAFINPPENRRHNRAPWDEDFNVSSPPGGDLGWFKTQVRDAWAYSMTPSWCAPVPGAPPSASCAANPSADRGYTGPASYDRGFTSADLRDEERLDYVLFGSPPGPNEMCVQHMTIAWNLNGGVPFEGGLTMNGVTLGGADPTSDHFGINAEIAPAGPWCNPTGAYPVPPGNPRGNTDVPANMAYPSSVQWFRIDAPGTYEFNVDPAKWTTPGTPNGLIYKVYDPRDLSVPIPPYKGESQTVDGEQLPGYTDAKFKVPTPPFYVKVYNPNQSFAGYYTFRAHRNGCASSTDACDLDPWENDETFPATSAPLVYPDGSPTPSAALYYSIHIDRADSPYAQTKRFYASQVERPGDPDYIDSLDLLARDGTTVVAHISKSATPPPGLRTWSMTDATAALEGDDQKYFLRLNRNVMVPFASGAVQFFVGWETNLLWFFGRELLGQPLSIKCEDTREWGDDDIWMQVGIDRAPGGATAWTLPRSGPGWPSGRSHDGFNLGAFDEGDARDWGPVLFSVYGGRNLRGVPLSASKSIKFVSTLEFWLYEDDGFDPDPNAMYKFDASRFDNSLPPATYLGWNDSGSGGFDFHTGVYKQQFNFAHARPHKMCTSDADCQAPVMCQLDEGVCR